MVLSSKIGMLSLRRVPALLLLAAGLCLPPAQGQANDSAASQPLPATASKATTPIPTDFAGWTLAAPLRLSTSATVADSTNADVLTEDGFSQFASGSYTRGAGRLDLRAIRFGDASGAYAAYTFYRRAGMRQEDIGLGAATDGTHILFWQDVTVVDATFDHQSAMSAAELRELARMLPPTSGSAGIAPPLPGYLPGSNVAPIAIEPLTTHYSLGPLGYVRSGGVLPATLVGFDKGAEVLSSAYTGSAGEGMLTLINYPTPQLAAERDRAIEAFLKGGNSPQAAWPQPLAESYKGSLLARRSGPLVAVTSGDLTEAEAGKLIGQVNYLADVTWNNPTGYTSEVSKTARLLISIVATSAILCFAALIVAVFLGGGRALLRRLRGKPVSSLNDAEFISLRLDKD